MSFIYEVFVKEQTLDPSIIGFNRALLILGFLFRNLL